MDLLYVLRLLARREYGMEFVLMFSYKFTRLITPDEHTSLPPRDTLPVAMKAEPGKVPPSECIIISGAVICIASKHPATSHSRVCLWSSRIPNQSLDIEARAAEQTRVHRTDRHPSDPPELKK